MNIYTHIQREGKTLYYINHIANVLAPPLSRVSLGCDFFISVPLTSTSLATLYLGDTGYQYISAVSFLSCKISIIYTQL